MQIYGDYVTNVHRALKEIDPNYMNCTAFVIAGSHSLRGKHQVDRMLDLIKVCRQTKLPFLGICNGYQLAVVEYQRNVMGNFNATSEEWMTGGYPIIKKRKELKVGLHEGESWWSYYEIDPQYDFQEPNNFFITQYHPEYQSWKDHPHPVLVNFLKYAMAM